MSEENKMLTREEWIAKIRSEGKHETIRGEMIRLGFWEAPNLTDEEIEQQAKEDEEYTEVRKELLALQKESKQLKDIDFLLKEARKRRIEESKQRRAERKAQREKSQAEAKEKWKQHRETHVIHVGDGVSAGLASKETNETKLMERQLPLIRSALQLAEEMGITLSELKWLTYHRNTATINHYTRFTIPKKNGGQREISAPKAKLRTAQTWIKETILDNLTVHPAAHGFVTGKSTVDNAKHHIGKDAVVKFDLKDFFPSISFVRVRGLFESLGYSRAISTLFALICTEAPRKEVEFNGKIYYVAMKERQLPQGACTSPTITNLLCRRLDEKLTQLARDKGFTYSRYADDLTLSGNGDTLQQIGSIMNSIRNIVSFEGFVVNEEKTRVLRAGRRQRVTGIVVNEKTNLTRKDIRSFRALLHNVEQKGLEEENHKNHPYFWEYINGYVSYVQMVRPDIGQKFATQVLRIAEKYGLPIRVHAKKLG
ncbi:reverse transcriptase family protein [Shimazuella kribbensis]|uniref:reverse transcriptase family protein n=1 Tax=Shimazuella kribbensis TaxID=139808 RepID=UPI000408670A|nr:reverse transcriptase family protein [Shimazuella kribbensis]